jgi:hypothetical protein
MTPAHFQRSSRLPIARDIADFSPIRRRRVRVRVEALENFKPCHDAPMPEGFAVEILCGDINDLVAFLQMRCEKFAATERTNGRERTLQIRLAAA